MIIKLKTENATLRKALRELQERNECLYALTAKMIHDLTDENDLLAQANRLLLEKQAQSFLVPSTDTPSLLQVPDELLLPGPELEMHSIVTIDNVHSFGNLLSVSTHATRPEIVITGCADKCISVHDWKMGRKLCETETSNLVLALAFNPNRKYADYFVAAGMDAKHALYRLVQEGDEWQIQTLGQFHDHSRHGVFKLAWRRGQGEDEQCEKIKSFYFNGTVEAIVFAPGSLFETRDEGAHELLVIAARDDCYVHYVDCSTFEKERVNMNPDGIEHVSYTIMDLSISSSGKYLLAATDASRHFIFSVRGGRKQMVYAVCLE
ncbi:unnamed protein product [Peronospora belbahrii]|uniref:Uncharacterized protein n=1 Tax=Peronospora belbahrii TaxID=622444 RepID=A0AAU9L4D3_9STRA|nr:unnamed protein product [Peronospora belbahrii]